MQRSLLHIGGPTLCVVLTLGLLIAGKSVITGTQSASIPEMTLETPDLSDVPTIGEEPVPGDAISGELSREQATGPEPMPFNPDAQPQDGTLAPAPVPEPPAVQATQPAERTADPAPLEQTILRHPVALSAGLVQFEGRTIQIAGVKPQSAERTCPATTGDWPCGTIARTAFRNFIRARAFTCQTPEGGWSGTITARCTVGSDDPALWLARNGWAEVDGDDAALTTAIASAKTTGKGFYRIGVAPSPPGTTPIP